MRASGILLPVTSLPSPYGIGCFSKEAYEFVDQLEKGGEKYWQILPLGPTGYGDSPYQSFSTYAGNPYFIDLETLIEEGLLTKEECDPCGADKGLTVICQNLRDQYYSPVILRQDIVSFFVIKKSSLLFFCCDKRSKIFIKRIKMCMICIAKNISRHLFEGSHIVSQTSSSPRRIRSIRAAVSSSRWSNR